MSPFMCQIYASLQIGPCTLLGKLTTTLK